LHKLFCALWFIGSLYDSCIMSALETDAVKNINVDFSSKQDNVRTNTESVQCISKVYSICPYKYNHWL